MTLDGWATKKTRAVMDLVSPEAIHLAPLPMQPFITDFFQPLTPEGRIIRTNFPVAVPAVIPVLKQMQTTTTTEESVTKDGTVTKKTTHSTLCQYDSPVSQKKQRQEEPKPPQLPVIAQRPTHERTQYTFQEKLNVLRYCNGRSRTAAETRYKIKKSVLSDWFRDIKLIEAAVARGQGGQKKLQPPKAYKELFEELFSLYTEAREMMLGVDVGLLRLWALAKNGANVMERRRIKLKTRIYGEDSSSLCKHHGT